VAHGTYIQECATEATKGFYFAYFWSFYMFSQVIGNLIGAFVLGSFKQSQFFLIMAAIAFSSTILFVLLPKPLKQKVKS
jgi:MFS family permease